MATMMDDPIIFDESLGTTETFEVIEALINAPVPGPIRPSADHLLMCKAPKDPNDYYGRCPQCHG